MRQVAPVPSVIRNFEVPDTNYSGVKEYLERIKLTEDSHFDTFINRIANTLLSERTLVEHFPSFKLSEPDRHAFLNALLRCARPFRRLLPEQVLLLTCAFTEYFGTYDRRNSNIELQLLNFVDCTSVSSDGSPWENPVAAELRAFSSSKDLVDEILVEWIALGLNSHGGGVNTLVKGLIVDIAETLEKEPINIAIGIAAMINRSSTISIDELTNYSF